MSASADKNGTRKANSPIEVATMLCHAHMDFGIQCLKSMQLRSVQAITLRVHDDGTLDSNDKSRLDNELSDYRLITREEGMESARKLVNGRPNLTRFASEHVFAIKLLEIPALGSEILHYCDCDIYFYRSFANLFDLRAQSADYVFLPDIWSGYSVNAADASFFAEYPCVSNANAGLFSFDMKLYDLDLLERVFSDDRFKGWPALQEQTAWPILGARGRSRGLAPSQFAMISPRTRFRPHWIAAHFSGPGRCRFEDLSLKTGSSASLAVRTRPARRLTPTRYRAYKLYTKIFRRWS
ncbi:MAG: hypothetical protein WCO71_04700 [Pseudomonadota bacterium]